MFKQLVPPVRALPASFARPSQSRAIPFHKRTTVIEPCPLRGADLARCLWHQENAHQATAASNGPVPPARAPAALARVQLFLRGKACVWQGQVALAQATGYEDTPELPRNVLRPGQQSKRPKDLACTFSERELQAAGCCRSS